ncbi:stAR-related lipid transfer protein 13 [Diorhabda sublineata]|uniref:stAR-related lipid transfer protein 13 n=1 Tax=Diorhabda sublineata TaxID=1163346 RepID=UPI0024E0FD51|nr:stAR-related lipid transfer protein 13 [Diorhabda sublineata]XP_056646433.1 stAR-related lipid transfer protein 13 [Diorhabda sublineata]XP_056646434.1 stAR-related lipid transfer protein 13 [Diorhabda sublineata]XP_056646435.1 stAR-related lipid transfer protein 13 [Diorhabda sublineata]XP_056646436.1 stAR-related lipid transfer protein 13 [Diorhabda sublineata]
MSCTDHYQDILKYLEESQNEIAKVFEVPCKTETIKKYEKKEKEETIKVDTDIRILMKLNEKIESDVTELLAKNELSRNTRYNDTIFNNLNGNGKDRNCKDKYSNQVIPQVGSSKNHLLIENHRICNDVSTQTSPNSLSPSYTNLTWASDYSSSPCLTSGSESDNEVFEDVSSLTPSPLQRPTFVKNVERKQILGSKFSSTPVLKTKYDKVNKQCRSQSDRHLAEIEAAEACKWLRATGFPQYAQFYEENRFPIDISTVSQDHPLLEPDVLHSLFRRLQILNSCAHLHQQKQVVNTDDSEEDECCALSDNWTYQSDIKRWSRTSYQPPIQHSSDNVPKESSIVNSEIVNKNLVLPNKPVAVQKEPLLKRGSIKYRQRREGIVVCEKNNLLDKLTQLQGLKVSDLRHNSDSEATPRTSRRSRTLSLDKTDTWSTTNIKINRIIWNDGPCRDVDLPDKDVEFEIEGPYLYSLCASQLQVLRKLALLKLTAHMEKYCPAHRTGWNWDLPKFLKKNKSPLYRDRNIFGVPLAVTFQRSGRFLPRQIEEAMQWLQENASDQVGIFRKSGVKSRIQMLRNKIEYNSMIDYSEEQCYDVADMLKQYFRELPETLLTGKLSETFVLIFQYIPGFLRMESVTCALLLMPEEHVQVLQALLHFLLNISSRSDLNQMNEYNLAMCLAPTLFHSASLSKPLQCGGVPHPKELAENKAAQECLMFFLKYFQNIFKIPRDFINQCNSSDMKEIKPKLLTDIGDDIGGWREYLNECQSNLLKETKEKSRGWVQIPPPCPNSKILMFYKKVADGLPLRLWKISAEIEAPPSEVTHRILRERHMWDSDLVSAKIIAQLDNQTEIFQYVRKSIVPVPNEEYCVIRTWKSKLPKDSCTIVETSVEYPGTIQLPNTIRGIVLASRYLVEPCGSGKSRVIHFSRVDTMGRSPDWYHKNYGYLCAVFIKHLQSSFYQNTNGPESQV